MRKLRLALVTAILAAPMLAGCGTATVTPAPSSPDWTCDYGQGAWVCVGAPGVPPLFESQPVDGWECFHDGRDALIGDMWTCWIGRDAEDDPVPLPASHAFRPRTDTPAMCATGTGYVDRDGSPIPVCDP